MASMTFAEAHKKLVDQKSKDQFVILLSIAENRLDQSPFKTLREYVEAPASAGGLNMSEKKVRALCYYNPAYTHQADEIFEELSYKEKVQPRNDQIREMREAGHTQQAIADEVGMSRNRISEILSEKQGIQKKPTLPKSRRSINFLNAESAANTILKNGSEEFVKELIEFLRTP